MRMEFKYFINFQSVYVAFCELQPENSWLKIKLSKEKWFGEKDCCSHEMHFFRQNIVIFNENNHF